MKSYTYMYHSSYGSDEILSKGLTFENISVSEDGLKVRLKINGLRELYVHELQAEGVRSRTGQALLHPQAYYTLNRIPK